MVIDRKGLSRDDRLSVPFTYMMERQNVNFLPSARKAALLLGHPLPGPTSDPSCWKSYSVHKTLTKSGIFTLKDIDMDITIRLPTPALYASKACLALVSRLLLKSFLSRSRRTLTFVRVNDGIEPVETWR